MNLCTYTLWVLSRKQYNSGKQPNGHKGQVKRKMFVAHIINNTFIFSASNRNKYQEYFLGVKAASA